MTCRTAKPCPCPEGLCCGVPCGYKKGGRPLPIRALCKTGKVSKVILSVSRRTDIPNWYSDWFYNRIREGFLYVRNPFNSRQISRIPLSPDLVDCIVFWTKNPKNMMPRLGELQDYDFLFQFTLTGYGKDVEPGVPDKKHMIGVFRALSEQIGHERVIWRYDPILLSERYTPEYHLKAFREIAERLAGYTDRVVISFVDFYAKMKKNAEKLRIRPITEREMTELAGKMAEAAGQNQMSIEACAEQTDLSGAGVRHGSCIDRSLIEKLTGCRLAGGKDRNQRKEYLPERVPVLLCRFRQGTAAGCPEAV